MPGGHVSALSRQRLMHCLLGWLFLKLYWSKERIYLLSMPDRKRIFGAWKPVLQRVFPRDLF